MIYDGAADPVAPSTRTGGIPLVPPDFDWPRCAECDGPMQFLAQIRLDDIDPAEEGLFSIFMCQNEPGLCLEWEPESGGNRAFVFRSEPLAPADVPVGGVVLLTETAAITYAAISEVRYERARQRWHTETGGLLRHVLGQLGGPPEWLQDDETPTCGGCAKPMTFVVQLEEGHDHRTSMNFGSGCGYGFRCRPCDTASFLWQP
ncbi:DUF1963 domain-containing protein [Micromonosporaceae bacterium DT194]|uniref:DUF1963 domain-containing protein n=1 Tax=Melissospora conviva TaxID=3388432 RepID=UPI003C23C1D4